MSKNKYQFTLDTAEKNDSHMGLATRIKQKQRVLELGCSSGYLSQFLKEDLACAVVGVDIDGSALQQADAFCVQTIVADLDSSDWLAEIKGQQFDVVLCADVLEHLKNPEALLASLKPFLHEKSSLLASVPNVAHASIRLELLQGHFDYESLGLLDDTHLHFYTRDGLIAMLMQAGYLCTDVSYSIHDLADEAIDQHLANAGLECTAAGRELLHAPDAVAFQYIIEAHLAPDGVEFQLPERLSPKPLLSSGVAYTEKQERIESLEQQLVLEQFRYQQHIQRLVAQAQSTVEQKPNSQHDGTGTESDNALFTLALQLAQERESNAGLSSRVKQLEERVSCLTNDNQHLEQVLQRVHGKLSYRVIRACKDIPQTITKFLRKAEQPEQDDKLAAFNYDNWLLKYGSLTDQTLLAYKEEANSWEKKPKIALLMPVYNPDKSFFLETLNSIAQQTYSNFELCIADDASTVDYVREILNAMSAKDLRIRVIYREQHGQISSAMNSALSLAEAEYVCYVGQHDVLTPDGLYWLVKAMLQEPEAQMIYSDEDIITLQGKRTQPYFKPDWNPELLLTHNYIRHLCAYKTQRVKALGGYDSGFNGAQDYDLILRYTAALKPEQVVHIPRVLYHWRKESDSSFYELFNKQVLEKSLLQRPAEVSAHQKIPEALRVRYVLPDVLPLVSIVIPTRNGFHLLHRCVESIFAKTKYLNYELIIIDNGSDELVTLRYLQRLQQDPRIRVIRDASPFNYSRLNNKAVAQAKGEIIGLLNNDLEVINSDWLDEMVSHVIQPKVGVVGAKLYYPDNTIQHAGVIVGLGGVAGHSHKHFPRDHPGYCGRLLLSQNLSAVTAACLLVKKEVFDAVGGLDEQHLAIAFNDVDLCLRIQEQGFSNVWTPYAEMYHHESASRGYEDTPEKLARFNKEVDYMKLRWGEKLQIDPAYNPNLTVDREDFSFSCPPRLNS